MRWLGTKRVRLGSIKLPADFKARLAAPHLKERAQSLADLGVINPPVIEWKTKELIAGCDRLACLVINGRKPKDGVEVRAVEATADEVRKLRIHENLHRRHDDKDALIRELIDLEPVGRWGSGEDGADNKMCAPAATKKAVYEQVAAKLGKTPAAVRQADYRARRAEKTGKTEADLAAERKAKQASGATTGPPPAPPPEPEPATLETWGVEVTPEFLASAGRLRAYVDDLDAKLRQVTAAVTRGQETLTQEQVTLLGLQDIRMQVRAIAERVRSLRPHALCHVCKGIPALNHGCVACRGTGTVGKAAVEAAPEELRRKGADAGVFVGPDAFRRLSELAT